MKKLLLLNLLSLLLSPKVFSSEKTIWYCRAQCFTITDKLFINRGFVTGYSNSLYNNNRNEAFENMISLCQKISSGNEVVLARYSSQSYHQSKNIKKYNLSARVNRNHQNATRLSSQETAEYTEEAFSNVFEYSNEESDCWKDKEFQPLLPSYINQSPLNG